MKPIESVVGSILYCRPSIRIRADESGAYARYDTHRTKVMATLAAGLISLAIAVSPAHAQENIDSGPQYTPTMLILDASGSMDRPDPADHDGRRQECRPHVRRHRTDRIESRADRLRNRHRQRRRGERSGLPRCAGAAQTRHPRPERTQQRRRRHHSERLDTDGTRPSSGCRRTPRHRTTLDRSRLRR